MKVCSVRSFVGKSILVAVCALMATAALGTTYIWTGAAGDLKWSTPGNWLVDGVAPESGYPVTGDTAFFSKTYVKEAFTIATETVTLGEGELTIQVDTASGSGFVKIGTIFEGPAKLVMTGIGRRYFMAANNNWTGGTEVRAGTLYAATAGNESFGKGVVTLKPANDTDYPRISPGAWMGLAITNRIDIVTDPSFAKRSTSSQCSIYSSNGGTLGGPVYSDGDFVIGTGSGGGRLVLNGDIHAHGHTLYAFTSSDTKDRFLQFAKSVDAHLVVEKTTNSDTNSIVRLSGRSDFVDNWLTIISGTNEFTATSAYWGGTNIVINPKSSTRSPRLKLKGGDNLNYTATVSIKTDTPAYIEVPSGQTQRLRRLIVNGTDVGTGVFTHDDFDFIVGGGALWVDTFCVWTGNGEAGKWSDPANWTNGKAPKAGSVVCFSSDVTLTEAYDFGDAEHPELEFGVDVASGATVTCDGVLSGGNLFVKRGKGIFLVHERNVNSGGTLVLDGDFEVAGVGSTTATREWPMPGTGPIELRRTLTTQPHLVLSSWCAVTNDVLITGPSTAYASNYGDFKFNNVSKFYGNVTATGDFKFHNQYNNSGDPLNMYGDISAAGHKMYATTRVENGAKGLQTSIRFHGTVDADIEKDGQQGPLVFMAGSQIGGDGQTLVLKGGTNVMAAASGSLAAASVGIKDITVDNAAKRGAALRIGSRDNLDRETVIKLVSDGKLILDSGVTAKVNELWVDGVQQADGYYKASTLPQAIGGTGRLRVGPPRGLLIMCK